MRGHAPERRADPLAQLPVAPGEPGEPDRLVLLVAGDDHDAKRHVADLIDEVGFEPVDTGDLAEGGRRQQPGTPLYGAELTPAEVRDALGID